MSECSTKKYKYFSCSSFDQWPTFFLGEINSNFFILLDFGDYEKGDSQESSKSNYYSLEFKDIIFIKNQNNLLLHILFSL